MEQVSRLPVSNAQGYMLNLPTQKVACDERREKLRPNLMFAMFFGQLKDKMLIVAVADESEFCSGTSRALIRNVPIVQIMFDIQGNMCEIVQSIISLMSAVYERYSKVANPLKISLQDPHACAEAFANVGPAVLGHVEVVHLHL